MLETLPDPLVFLGATAIVESEPMRNLLELIQRIARADAGVLITGESGSGKELIARAIHFYSPRSQKPWVDLNCAALPENLLESELFGHEKGAFSGADTAKPGLFELADRGTIFLDEIGELDPRMQVKLLRVLDGVPYYRVGGVKKVAADTRVVAATNHDLERAVAEGRFRSDLFHRLSQFVIAVPPLRARPGDVRALALHFLRQCDPNRRFSAGALNALENHSWPGNVRELRNTVLQAAVLSSNLEIVVEDLHIRQAAPFAPVTKSSHNGRAPAPPAEAEYGSWKASRSMDSPIPIEAGASGGFGTSLDNMERRMIFEALRATGGHQQRAAQRLGISRRTLSRKLKLYETELTRAVG